MTITSTDYALLVEDSYKDHLVHAAAAMAVIAGAQGLNASNSADNVAAAGRASLIAALGVAGPPLDNAQGQCVAVVTGNGAHITTSAATVRAVELPSKACRDAGLTNCHAYYTACSLPVRSR